MAVLMWDFSQIRVEGGIGHPARPRLSSWLSLSLHMAPRMAPDDRRANDRRPMALHSFFSEYLSRYTRGQGSSLSPFRGSGARDGTDGRLLAAVAAPVRPVELGLPPLGRLVRPGRLGAPEGLLADGSGSVRRATGQHDRARAHERGGRTPKPGDGSRPRSQPGRFRHSDPQAGGSPGPSPAPARDGRPAPRQHPGPGGTWTGAPRPCLIADRAR